VPDDNVIKLTGHLTEILHNGACALPCRDDRRPGASNRVPSCLVAIGRGAATRRYRSILGYRSWRGNNRCLLSSPDVGGFSFLESHTMC
jgi:hypothetical protein